MFLYLPNISIKLLKTLNIKQKKYNDIKNINKIKINLLNYKIFLSKI
ncbi:MAG: hypothetical protein ABNO52_00150 [Candidatus Shikimatogenerans sp. Tser]|uniref:Uncharacterized protein n=1 Tax=Candidatus Shikimatogenerans sp. Tser TaxID=3158568 RepID=A0AAU7QR34_9FLAO